MFVVCKKNSPSGINRGKMYGNARPLEKTTPERSCSLCRNEKWTESPTLEKVKTLLDAMKSGFKGYAWKGNL